MHNTPGAFKSLALAFAKRLPTTAGSVTALLPWNPVQGNCLLLGTCPWTLWACLTSSRNYINISQFLKNSAYINTYSHILSLSHTHTHTHTHTHIKISDWIYSSDWILIHLFTFAPNSYFYWFTSVRSTLQDTTNSAQGSQVGHRKV